ncbi:STAS/SEC14 domain-containing protein [Sorangium sp. So ce269]
MPDLGPEGARLILRDEPDGILYMALHGELSEEMARAMVGAFRRMADSGREVLVLSDMHHAGPLPPGPRKTTADEMRTARLDAVAIIGAAFSVRVIATLAAKGVQLLTSRS